jgi:hypothetical protein
MWKRRCKHQYEEQSRRFTQINPNKIPKTGTETDDTVEMLVLLGATSILLRCEKCGDFKSTTIAGNFVD